MKTYIFALALFFMVSAEQSLETTLQNLDLTQINPGAIAGIEESEQLIREKCLKNADNETYDAVLAAREDFQKCVKGLIDIEEIQKEIAAAKPNGDLDTVFKKYCRKSPELKECITNFTNVFELCMDEQEKGTKNTLLNVTDSMINFICFKEGDRIALFIAEGGPECIGSKMSLLSECANNTFSKQLGEGEELNADNLPEFVIDKEKCRMISEVQRCVVKELEACTEPTPANIVDSMFNFVRKSTPCAKYSPTTLGLEGTGSGSSTMIVSILALSTLLLPIL